MSDRPTTHITPCELCVAWGVFCKFEFNSRVDLVANHVTRDPTAVRKQSQTRKITEIREGTSSDSKSSRWVGECLAVRFLDLERCSGSCPFSLGFATPGASSDSKSSRWVGEGQEIRFQTECLCFDYRTQIRAGPCRCWVLWYLLLYASMLYALFTVCYGSWRSTI